MGTSGTPEPATEFMSAEERKARRNAAAGSGGRPFVKRRLAERFQVPNTFVVCERKAAFWRWRRVGPPCVVEDLGLGGLSLLAETLDVSPGEMLRLTVHLPDKMPIRIMGQVAHTRRVAKNAAALYGITFADYDAAAWAMLCDMYKRHRNKPVGEGENAAKKTRQRSDLSRLAADALQV